MSTTLITIGCLVIGVMLLNFGFKSFRKDNIKSVKPSGKTIILMIMGVAFLGLFFYYLVM